MTNYTFDNLEKLIRAKDTNRLVIFAGAGVSMNSDIPSWDKLVNHLAQKIDLEDSKLDSLKKVQLYLNKRKHRDYYDTVKKLLKFKVARYNPINELIIKLSPSIIITTNYDDLFEQVITKSRENYSIIRQNKDLPNSRSDKYLVKMHGCLTTENIVLNEDDYLNYSRNFSLVESFVKGIFASKIILFVGFSYDDYNLKLILESVNNVLGSEKNFHFIFFSKPKSQIEKEYFELKGLHPIFFEEIGDIVSFTKNSSNLKFGDEGLKLYNFLDTLLTFDIEKYENSKLPIINQIEKSLEPFKDFRMLMPQVFLKLFPLNIGNENNDWPPFNKNNPFRINFNNPEVLNLLKWRLIPEEKSKDRLEGIYSLEELKEKYGNVDNTLIKSISKGSINTVQEYKLLETFLLKLNATFVYYINKYDIKLRKSEKQCECIECCFEKFEFRKVVEILNKSEYNSNDFPNGLELTHAYLVKGYYANKFGFQQIAFDSLKKAYNEAFLDQNEILRFFSSYNLKNFNIHNFNDWAKSDFYQEEQNKINLNDIFKSLDLSKNVKDELEKITNEKYLNEGLEFIRDLKKQLKKKWEYFEKGGYSFGGNELTSSFVNGYRLMKYYEYNFLVDTEYVKIHKIAEDIFESLLISHTIKRNKINKVNAIFSDSEILKEFEYHHLHLFIHYSSSEWHKKEIRLILKNRKIKISSDSIPDLVNSFSNFLSSYYIGDNHNEVGQEVNVAEISQYYTFKLFGNFLELIYISDFLDEETVILLPKVINFLCVTNFPSRSEESQLREFIHTKGSLFSTNQLIQLIEIFIKKGITHYVKELVDQIKDFGQKLEFSIGDLDIFFKENQYVYLKALGYIHKFTIKDVQLKIEQHLEEKLMTNFDSITFLQLYDYDCFDKQKLTAKYILEEKGLLKETYPQENSVALNNFLQFISRNYTNPNIKKLAKEPNKNTYVNWLLNFETFDYQYFNLDWFKYFITQLFLKFMKHNKEVKKQLREFLLNNKDVELQNQYSRPYLENFETID